jgi:peptidoglycan/LPS O-acetylase OafA/YrhL
LNATFLAAIDCSCALLLPWLSTLERIWQPVDFIFRWVSVLSYSLYLCHTIALHYAGGLTLKLYRGEFSIKTNVILIVLLSFVFSLATYFLIEKRFLAMRDRRTVGT